MSRNTLIGGKLMLKNDKVSKKTKMQIATSTNSFLHSKSHKETIKLSSNQLINQSLEEIEQKAFDISNTSTNEEKDLMKQYQNQIDKNASKSNQTEESEANQEPLIELFTQMTPAEKLFEERRLKRLPEKIKKLTRTSFKEKYQTYYKSLTKLPEHHDIPKVGPG